MLQDRKSVPTGPRTTRQNGNQGRSRHPTRGGIQKRQSTPARADRDGDVDMDGPESKPALNRTARSGRGTAIRGAASQRQSTPETSGRRPPARTPRNGIDPSTIQRAVFRDMGNSGGKPNWPKPKTASHARGSRDHLTELKVHGLRQSKASTNPDGGVSSLIAFLERKATHDEQTVRISKSRVEGDILIVYVRPADAGKILKVNNYTWAGTQLKIEESADTPYSSSSQSTEPASSTIDVLKRFLNERYNAESKLLDLSQTASDPELVKIGMFNTISRESKFFPALMKICEDLFTSSKEKEDAVASVSLANNALPDIGAVTTLAQTFPNLKNLDLSNNQISRRKDIEGWRWKFPKLNHIILSGNPIEANDPDLRQEIMRWYPTVTSINADTVRTSDQVEAAKSSRLPLPTRGANFQDEASIGENFVRTFFSEFDLNRTNLVGGYYDNDSTFSLCVNTSAPRADVAATEGPQKWDQYIHKSRNLSRITHLSARRERLYRGSQAIRECFDTLPATEHPDLVSEPQKWCIECSPIPGLPEATGQSVGGVGGLLVTVHGEFVEALTSGAASKTPRSFDRTFVLGPGGGIGGVRVICDTMVLRAYGGHNAWRSEDGGEPQSTQPMQHQIPVPAGFGIAGANKTQEEAQKEVLALELSKATGMTLEYSGMCLDQSGWVLEAAYVTFEQAKVNLPPEAFIS